MRQYLLAFTLLAFAIPAAGQRPTAKEPKLIEENGKKVLVCSPGQATRVGNVIYTFGRLGVDQRYKSLSITYSATNAGKETVPIREIGVKSTSLSSGTENLKGIAISWGGGRTIKTGKALSYTQWYRFPDDLTTKELVAEFEGKGDADVWRVVYPRAGWVTGPPPPEGSR